MNICFINSGYPSPTTGGVERVTYNLTHVFREHGHQVGVLVLEGTLPPVTEQLCPCFLVPEPGHWGSSANVEFFRQLQRKWNIQLVIVQSEKFPAVELCEQGLEDGVKVISVFHTAPFPDRGTLDDCISPEIWRHGLCWTVINLPFLLLRHWRNSSAARKWEREKLRRQYALSDAFVTLSPRFHQKLAEFLRIMDSNKLYAIPNPSVTVAESAQKKDKLIIWVGRMTFTQKRPDRMVRIWETIAPAHPDWHLALLGDGEAREVLEAYCSRKKIPRISFVGTADPIPYYRRANILCLTSSWEGWGLVLTEAMSYNCVPVAYDSFSPLRDIIQDGETGLAVPAFDETVYRNRLEWLMTHNNERDSMAEKTSPSVQRFSMERILRQWEELFQQVMNK